MELATLTTLEGMDSRDIASLTGKDHKNVIRDIRVMLSKMEVDSLKFESLYKAGNGEMRRCFILPKRECLLLASGYSIKLRAAIIDRWAELEKAKPQMTRLEFARALLEAEEMAEQVERENQSLMIELDKSKEYTSIKRMEKITGKKFSWRKLKAQGHEMGVESKEVFDENYGTVKAYRMDVWMETYGVSI